jgi:hypothetical protein
MLRRVAVVKTDASEELRTSFIRLIGISELGTTLAVISCDARFIAHDVYFLFSSESTGYSEVLYEKSSNNRRWKVLIS